jgi:hypothetical protein
MPGGRAKFCLQPDPMAVAHEPFGAGQQIFFVLRLRRDAGESEQLTQFVDEAGLVLFQVIEDNLHGA